MLINLGNCEPKILVIACAVVRIESINWSSDRSNFRNIRIIHNKRQTPPDRLFGKSTIAETQEESRNKSIDASALLIGLRNCESWFEHRPSPPVNQQVYLTNNIVDFMDSGPSFTKSSYKISNGVQPGGRVVLTIDRGSKSRRFSFLLVGYVRATEELQ